MFVRVERLSVAARSIDRNVDWLVGLIIPATAIQEDGLAKGSDFKLSWMRVNVSAYG